MKKNLTGILILIAVTGALTFLIFKPVLMHPNSYLFSHGGDAVKSYFNFSYYLKYDSGLKHDGINYPYGDHLQYINSHPFHVAILKQVDKIVPISNYGVAILNLSMILSLLLAVPFLFLILRHYKLPVWYSVLISLIILFLSPQLDRIKGHFEMVYLFFIPMFWYLLIQFRSQKNKILWGTLLVASGIIGGFTSAYFASFYAILLLSVIIADLWYNRSSLKTYLRPGITLFLMAIFPLLAVRGLVGITDWVSDRPTNPWGFFVFHSTPFSIFLPPSNGLREMISEILPIKYQWEGRAYVGLPATLLALSMIFAVFRYIFTKQKNVSMYVDDEMNTYLLGAFLVLLFSMCFPFKYGLGVLLEVIPPVKQFRALGRFSWIFYYVFTVYAAYFYYNLYLKLKARGFVKLPVLFLSFVILFWSYDAIYNSKHSFKGIFLKNDKLEADSAPYQKILSEANINPEDYQAIFFLPFANTAGDKLLFEGGLNAFSEAMNWSYHTGIPLIQSFSPRLSFENALSSIQMLSDISIRKTRLDDMNDKAILLVYTNEEMSEREIWLKRNSKKMWHNHKVTLAHVDTDVFTDGYLRWSKFVSLNIPKLKGTKQIKANVPLEDIYFNDFESTDAKTTFHGQGALYERRKKMDVFHENFSEKGMSGIYELSFWMYFDTRMYDMPQPKLMIYDKNNQLLETIRLNNRQIHNVFEHWVRVEQLFEIEKNRIYKLTIDGKHITIDDLLLKPRGSNVLINFPNGEQSFNNFPYQKEN